MEIYVWLLLGGAAFVLVLVNLIRAAMKKHRGWQMLLFASLSCGGLTMMCALQAVNGWVRRWQVDQLLDVEPTLAVMSAWALCLGIVLNLLALRFHLRAEKSKEAPDGKG